MKTFSALCHLLTVLFGLVLLTAPGLVIAQETSPLRIDLVTSKHEYLVTDPIKMRITVTNTNVDSIDVQEKFFARDFHLLVKFIDPDGQVVVATTQGAAVEPDPPEFVRDLAGRLRPAVPCETIEGNEFTYRIVDDLRNIYDLTKLGLWEGRVVTSLLLFQEAVTKRNGEQRCFLDGTPPRAFTPLTSNLVRFKIVRSAPVADSSIDVRARFIKIGTGTHPPVEKSNIGRMPVYLIREAAIPPDLQPINHKTYPFIFDELNDRVKPFKSGLTDRFSGVVSFAQVPQDAYVIVGRHDRSGLVVGAKVGSDEPEWATPDSILKQLIVMKNNKGKRSAGKATVRNGSVLWIFEPEYVEWDGTQELYPFVFDSSGDWSVTTSITPPEGFVTDYPELSADVSSESKAVQFTVTDIGSSWKETKVKHRIRRKGRSEIIESAIGVRLSKRLAKAKGLPVYGETGSPRRFGRGKKAKQ